MLKNLRKNLRKNLKRKESNMNITLHNFKKRVNSTKRPSGGTTVNNVFWKEETGFYNPVLELSGISNVDDYTYLEWHGRYYYIEDKIALDSSTWKLSCTIDVLASWKTDILATSAFVLYSASNYDTDIPDTRLSTKSTPITGANSVGIFGGLLGRYVVTYISDTSVNTVALSKDALNNLTKKIASKPYAEMMYNPVNAVSKILSNTASCITSCNYVPKCNTGGLYSPILAGGFNTDVGGSTVVEDVLSETVTVSIPWHFSDFRNRSQYSKMYIYLPGYGYQALNIDDYIGKSGVRVTAFLDSVVGEITYIIDGKTRVTTAISSQKQVSTTTSGNVLSALSSAVGGAVSGAGGNVVGAGVGAFNAITSSLETTPGSVGTNGGRTSWESGKTIQVVVLSHDTNVSPGNMTSVYGRPLNATVSLGSLSGYCQCAEVSVSCGAPETLKNKINSYLKGGCYIE